MASPGIHEFPPGTGQPRHHGANRQRRHFGDLAIGKLLDLAQDYDFTQASGQCRDSQLNSFRFASAKQRLLRRVLLRRHIESIRNLFASLAAQSRRSSAILQRRKVAIAHNREQPGAGVATATTTKTPVGAQKRILHDILRGIGIPAQESRKAISRVEQRHDLRMK